MVPSSSETVKARKASFLSQVIKISMTVVLYVPLKTAVYNGMLFYS